MEFRLHHLRPLGCYALLLLTVSAFFENCTQLGLKNKKWAFMSHASWILLSFLLPSFCILFLQILFCFRIPPFYNDFSSFFTLLVAVCPVWCSGIYRLHALYLDEKRFSFILLNGDRNFVYNSRYGVEPMSAIGGWIKYRKHWGGRSAIFRYDDVTYFDMRLICCTEEVFYANSLGQGMQSDFRLHDNALITYRLEHVAFCVRNIFSTSWSISNISLRTQVWAAVLCSAYCDIIGKLTLR